MTPGDGPGSWRLATAASLVTIGGSAGAIPALRTIISALPDDLAAAVVVVIHRPADRKSDLVSILRRCTHMPVVAAHHEERIVPGVLYVADPDRHLVVRPDLHFGYEDGRRIKFFQSAVNPLFESAAGVFDGRVVAVVLSGGGSDATDGVQTVKAHGGIVVAQDPITAEHGAMPESAVRTGAVDYVLPVEAIAPAVADLVRQHATRALT